MPWRGPGWFEATIFRVVAIVIGGSGGVGREVVRALASRTDAVVVVYLHDQRAAEAAVDEVLATGGSAVAVRADVRDELDVERLLDETSATFGSADLVVHAVKADRSLLDQQTAPRLRPGGEIVTVATADDLAALLGSAPGT